MNIQFVGATHGVTGSAHIVNACGKTLLIDYGMRQGREEEVDYSLPIAAKDIDAVLITHSHIDHTGYLPLLAKEGFQGRIYATKATVDLVYIMLMDSAHIQEQEAMWQNRKNKRSGRGEIQPLYSTKDAQAILKRFKPVSYLEKTKIFPNIWATFYDVGHLLGSAAIQLELAEKEEKRTIVFSGDIGNIDQPLIKDPDFIEKADYIVCESTYGDRLHQVVEDYRVPLANIIQETFDKGGNVVIPAFAVGRTQELLYFLRDIIAKGMVKGHLVPVYLDSPLAIEAVKVFDEHIYGYFDKEAMALVKEGIDPINFPSLKVSTTSDESRLINFDKTPKVIISASGMCDAGRIRHHLKHNLWRKESTVVFVGYQAEGSLGRHLLDGAKEVRLFGEDIEVNAKIVRLEGISGHADQKGLLRWLQGFKQKPQKLFLVHGEEDAIQAFKEHVETQLGFEVYAPFYQDTFDLISGKQTFAGQQKTVSKRNASYSKAYSRLLCAFEQLSPLVKRAMAFPNEDLNAAADTLEQVFQQLNR